MEKPFILNLVHRLELSPEYSQKTTGAGGKEEDFGGALTSESVEIFKIQQELAHRNGLKTTIQLTYASLFSDECIELARKDHEKYGDEISLSLLGLPCDEFKNKYKTKDFCIWMFSEEDKKAVVDDVFALFKEKLGFYPESTGSYFLDAFTLNYIHEHYPSVKCAIATCFEEGPKAYHTCNNSWYTFFDGGPWNPWVPGKDNSHVPAVSKEDDCGIVCIPHLSRDVMACFDGNGSNFGTHPQNVLRGMIYDDKRRIPYLYNLIDQYRHLGKYNRYAYNMMFVGPGWMNKAGRWEVPYEGLYKSYEDAMRYYGKLKKEGKLLDLTMAEFADFYREGLDYEEPERCLWKDILYGSSKEYFWYLDPYMRTCLDFNQGGAMIDFRPYAARLPKKVGIGTESVYDASYPYLIQANYRAGYFTHYAGEGTVKSYKVKHGSEVYDGCLQRTLAKVEVLANGDTLVRADPVEFVFSDLKVAIESSFLFKKGEGKVEITRKVVSYEGEGEIEIEEYFTGAFGTTEYQADMTRIVLSVEGKKGEQSLNYAYKCRNLVDTEAKRVSALIPDVATDLEMGSEEALKGSVDEGYAFSPVYRLSLAKTLKGKGEIKTWLSLKKAN